MDYRLVRETPKSQFCGAGFFLHNSGQLWKSSRASLLLYRICGRYRDLFRSHENLPRAEEKRRDMHERNAVNFAVKIETELLTSRPKRSVARSATAGARSDLRKLALYVNRLRGVSCFSTEYLHLSLCAPLHPRCSSSQKWYRSLITFPAKLSRYLARRSEIFINRRERRRIRNSIVTLVGLLLAPGVGGGDGGGPR